MKRWLTLSLLPFFAMLMGISECTPVDVDGDGWTVDEGDCNDQDASIHPGADEVCDGIDQDCDDLIDQELTLYTSYQDGDGDGYGLDSASITDCAVPVGYVPEGGDCDDVDAAINPGEAEQCNGIDDDCDETIDDGLTRSTWYLDADADGYGDPNTSIVACAAPEGYVGDDRDCNDGDPSISPVGTETCNEIDDDCDGVIDDGISVTTWYVDADGDGYGASSSALSACSQPEGYVAADGDCNDASASVHPGATETCNSVDDNCDGTVDDGVSVPTWYRDADGDGYGASSPTLKSCTQPSGYVAASGDCNDASASAHPEATESCNGIDDDCDGWIDEGLKSSWYLDGDGDGYGLSSASQTACTQPSGYVATAGDCDDANASVYPGASEACNSVDDDCDGQVDEGLTATWYLDADGDGYGASASSVSACSQPTGYVSTGGDCNDTVATVSPAAAESCDSIDNDCDGLIDEGAVCPSDCDQTSVWFVDASSDPNTADGLSWATAFPTVAEAVTAASSCPAPVWVAAGTYRAGSDGAAVVELAEGVEVYGGFDGTEGSFEARAGLYDETLLSGDRDGSKSCSRPDSEHVVVGASQARLDGFTITRGCADSGSGGGMYNVDVEGLELENLTFTANYAKSYGGGMYNDGASLTMSNVAFDTNTTAGSGGAIANRFGASVSITGAELDENKASVNGGAVYIESSEIALEDVSFAGNQAKDGGALYNYAASPTLTSVFFDGNVASGGGGAVYDKYYAQPVMSDVELTGNTAANGGALYEGDYSAASITDSMFSKNTATGSGGAIYTASRAGSNGALGRVTFSENSASYGGAIYSYYASVAPISDCTFGGNSASYGGAIYSYDGNADIDACLFSDNTATSGGGGAIYQRNYSSLSITGSTFASNSASGSGGAIYSYEYSRTIVTHGTFYANQAGSGGAYYEYYKGSSYYASTLADVLFLSNTATSGAAVYVANSGFVTLTNATFSQNTATNGGGVYVAGSGSVTVANSAFWRNDGLDLYVSSGSANVSYSCLYGGYTGTGNVSLTSNPFTTADQDGDGINEVYLKTDSACVDAGSDSAANSTNTGLSSDWWKAMTTRTDCALDTGTVDMGMHYDAGICGG